MKGKVIVDDVKTKEDSELGVGIECPNCEADMQKTVTADVSVNLAKGQTKTNQNPSHTVFVCHACGYREEVERS